MQSEGIELTNGETIKSLEKGHKYLGMLQFDSVKNKEMKDMITKEYYHQRIRKILKSSLNERNTIQAINARVMSIIRYKAGIVEWKGVERVGTGLISVEEFVEIGKTSLGFYLKEQEQQLQTEAVIKGVISDDKNPKDVKTQLLQQRNEN